MTQQLVDIGANLTHESFEHDLEEVLARAEQAGVARILLTGTDSDSTQAALALSTSRPELFRCTAGIHPHLASTWGATEAALIASLARRDEVVAVGECGLDFNRDFSPRDAQCAVFEAHLEIASEVGKPVFLHQRDAHTTFLPILRDHVGSLRGGVVHCFTDSRQALEDYLDLGMYIGITGWVCDERRGLELQELVKSIPLDRLLVETDAPYLLPRTLRPRPKSRRNEPCDLPEVVTTLARCMDRSEEEIAAHSTANAERLFELRR